MDDEAVARDPIDVLVEEFFEQRRRGDASDPDDFARRVPGREEEFRELVKALGVLEAAAAATKAASAAGAAAAVPERLGRYRLLRRIGRGGMGTVYEAIDDELGRPVALKVLPGFAMLDPRELARFRREAQSAARLHHPHIVPIFAVGEECGIHWIAMQFIAGRSLADGDASAGRMPPPDVARHGLALADALACAHAEGIVHRDVKPSNVLLDRSDTIWITDFGLATAEDAARITKTGEAVGTPRYMAPEAFSGWADPRTDVWGVGVTLYELLAGRPAFDGTTRAQLLKQIGDVEPPALLHLDPALPRDLATIVHHCLQKEPGARYATARELADDLRRFLDGAPIHARPPSLGDRAAFLVRRHRVATIAAGAALLVIAGLAIAWAESLRRRSDRLAQEKARAEANLEVASEAIQSVLDEAASDVVFRAPALDPLRRRVLEAALAFELRLLEHQAQDSGKRFHVALAHLQVAQIDWELRKLDESRAHFESAATLLRELDGTLDDAAVVPQLASAYAGLACVARDRGDFAAAQASLREALARVERWIGGEPKGVDQAHHLAFVATLLGDLLTRDRQPRAGAELLRATLPRVTPWLDRADATPFAQRVLRDAEVQLAEAEHQAGEARAAVAALRRALAMSGRLVAKDDADVRDRAFDAARRAWLAALLLETGATDEARPLLAQARADLEAIVQRWPMVPEFRRDLADALSREAASEAELVRAIELADGCLAERPEETSFALAALRARNTLVTWRADGGDAVGARAIARANTDFLDARRAEVAAWPAVAFEQAAVAWYDRGFVEQELGQVDAARAAFARARELVDTLGDGPFARPLRLRIGITHGALLTQTGELDAGLAMLADVATRARQVAAASEPELAALLVQALNLDANARMRSDAPDAHAAAAAKLEEAIAVAKELVARFPERAAFIAALGMAHGDAGYLAMFAGDPPRARAEFLLALLLLQRAIEREPRQAMWRRALAFAMDGLAGNLEAPKEEEGVAAIGAMLEVVAAAATAASTDPAVLVESARVFARAATVKHGQFATFLGAPARDPWADAAMERLRLAGEAGFRDAARMERDVAFDALRSRDDFRDWLAELTSPAGR